MIFVNKIRVEKIQLNIPKFKGIATGLKVIQLSDLHISRFGYREKKLAHLANREQPDVILITGDLVVNYKNDFSACIQILQKLNAKHGLFAVFGNSEHTFKPIQHLHDFIDALRDIQVTLLNNQNIELKLNGKKLYLVGVDDPFFHFDNFEEAIKGVPVGAPTLLLAHSPDILFPRSDAMVINLLESPLKKEHFKEWGWEDSTYFGPEKGDVYFQNDSSHTIRVQSRQDGVSLDTVLLNPYKDIDDILQKKNFEHVNNLLISNEMHNKYSDLVVIPASAVKRSKIFGKWKKVQDASTLFHFRLDDMPPQKKWQFQPLINPEDYFEASFLAKKGVRYHVWVRMKAYKGNPKNDSVYIQFDDSVDKDGREKFRMNKPACSKERMSGVDLILTGHTHGGQVRIPRFRPLATLTSIGDKYISGLYRVGKSMLYVSRGFGYSAVPIRLFCPPEITVFSFL